MVSPGLPTDVADFHNSHQMLSQQSKPYYPEFLVAGSGDSSITPDKTPAKSDPVMTPIGKCTQLPVTDWESW